MRLVQFALADGSRRVGIVENNQILELIGIATVRELALSAISKITTLVQVVASLAKGKSHSYDTLINENPILPPLDHPDDVEGIVSVRRGSEVVWEKPFATGDANMSHSLANLEYHHFKYNQFLRPGDVHVLFLGTTVASFGDSIVIQDVDVFEVHIPAFGRPLINGTHREAELCKMGTIAAL